MIFRIFWSDIIISGVVVAIQYNIWRQKFIIKYIIYQNIVPATFIKVYINLNTRSFKLQILYFLFLSSIEM